MPNRPAPGIRRCVPDVFPRSWPRRKSTCGGSRTPEIATDNWYADLDDDGVPDLAIGRLPADSPQDLAVMVAKILAYESVQVPGPWCQRDQLRGGCRRLGAAGRSDRGNGGQEVSDGRDSAGIRNDR